MSGSVQSGMEALVIALFGGGSFGETPGLRGFLYRALHTLFVSSRGQAYYRCCRRIPYVGIQVKEAEFKSFFQCGITPLGDCFKTYGNCLIKPCYRARTVRADLAELRLFPRFPPLVPNTRAKILSTFFNCRGRSNAYSICLRGTLPVICLSASTNF